MMANFVMEALRGLSKEFNTKANAPVHAEIETLCRKQLSSVQGVVISSNKNEITVIFPDGSALTKSGEETFLADSIPQGKKTAKQVSVLEAFNI